MKKRTHSAAVLALGLLGIGVAATARRLRRLVDMVLALKNIFWVQYYPTMALLRQMRARGFGRIVNVTSLAGKLPLPHLAAYVAAKTCSDGLVANAAHRAFA